MNSLEFPFKNSFEMSITDQPERRLSTSRLSRARQRQQRRSPSLLVTFDVAAHGPQADLRPADELHRRRTFRLRGNPIRKKASRGYDVRIRRNVSDFCILVLPGHHRAGHVQGQVLPWGCKVLHLLYAFQ